MTPYTSNIQRLNAETVARYAGPKEPEETASDSVECKYCGHKPEDQGHRCIDCNDEISEGVCKVLDGRCRDCDEAFISSLKH